MRKFVLAALAVYLVLPAPALARPEDKHALGDLYARALNAIASRGMLDTLEPKKQTAITDIHMDHGLIYVTVMADSGPATVIFDPMVNRILSTKEEAEQQGKP